MDLNNFILIAGPCVLESEALGSRVAEELVTIQEKYPNVTVVFKSSIDKANRSSIASFRGNGFAAGLEVLARIKERYGLPITTDFHEPSQAQEIAAVCDIIQIPAFLCRQSDMLFAAAQTKKPVSVKKGQFLSPWDMKFVVEKLEKFGAQQILQMERGASFGYGNLVVDMRSFPVLRKNRRPVIYDVTHSLQLPGMGCETTRGAREFADTLARSAIAAGIDGLYIETHPDPASALCDAETQLPLATLARRVDGYLRLQQAVREIFRDED